MKNILLVNIALILFISAKAQTMNDDSTTIVSYLNRQLDYRQIRLSCQMLDSIASAELYCTKMNFMLNDGALIPTSYDLIKTEAGFKPVHSSQELICCPEFLASINKDFRLKDEKSALKFQEILDVVDRWNNTNSDRSFFRKENNWYFIRDRFFDDSEFFVVETNRKGKIISISFHRDDKDMEIPEEVTKSNTHCAKWGYKIPVVIAGDSAYLRSYFDKETNFHFEFTKKESRLAKRITTADFYKAKIVFTKEGFSNAITFNLLKTHDTVIHANSARELLEEPAFFASLKEDLILKTEDDALTFEEALDAIAPVGTFDVDNKGHLLIDGKWYFVRGESFGDKAAFIVETDNEGKILVFTYNNKAIEKQD